MSDAYCMVCGEPWDYYGARHGDMEKWEFELFRKGAGCPSCEGEADEPFEPTQLRHADFGDEDGLERLLPGEKPKWEKPESVKLWQCDGCGVHAVRDANQELAYELPKGSPAARWSRTHPFHDPEKWLDIDAEPAHIFQKGQKVCEFCIDYCEECDKELSSQIDFDDVYDDGYSFPTHSYFGKCRYLCVDCYEKQSSEEDEE